MVEVLEVMDPTKGGKMIDVINADVAAGLWGVMAFVKAGHVMDAIVTG